MKKEEEEEEWEWERKQKDKEEGRKEGGKVGRLRKEMAEIKVLI